jgi:hypothetical protein
MTDTEINIAIAEVRGWDFDPFEAHEWGSRGRWCKSPEGEMRFRHNSPDYCKDLNAMHEAEMVLQNQFTTLEETYWRNLAYVKPHPIYATAAQRAVAFLRTLGKWEEVTPI